MAALVVLHIDGRKPNGMLRRSGGSAAFVVSSPEPRKYGWKPGISVFKRTGQKTVRVSEASFSPGDDFCTVYHLFDLLPGGAGDWSPKAKYVAGSTSAGGITALVLKSARATRGNEASRGNPRRIAAAAGAALREVRACGVLTCAVGGPTLATNH